MNNAYTPSVPIACDLSVFTKEERDAHLRLMREVVYGRATHGVETTTGIELHYAAGRAHFAELARWSADEARCCPFLSFELALSVEGEVTLRISGPDGARELLASVLESTGVPTAPAQ